MSVADAAARLAAPALAPIVGELHRRMGASARPVRSIEVELDEAGRVALADLMGLDRLPPQRCLIRTATLASALGVSPSEMRQVVGTVAGPIADRAGARRGAADELARAVADAEAAAGPLGDDAVRWAAGAVRSLTGPVPDRAADVLTICQILTAPRPQPRPLPVVAAEWFADTHALDAGSRRGELLTAAAAATAGQPPPRTSRQRRDVLAAMGILSDDVSSTVLSWGLVPTGDHPLRSASEALCDAGEAFSWTLSLLRRWPPVPDGADRVLVVENPAVLATAAAQHYDHPVVCTSGVPSVAAQTLLEQLADAGARLDCHADFDTAGMRIVAGLAATVGAVPFMMGAADYERALERAGTIRDAGAVPATPWDPALAAVFATDRRVVFEEQLLDEILT